MKKVLSNSKLSSPSKFVRRVLSRTTNVSTIPAAETNNSPKPGSSESLKSKPDRIRLLELEISGLMEQVNILQISVNTMNEDAEKREKALAKLARDKQQLSTDLKREQRSFTSLKQQLEDERKFYYKEKEQYCNEMNDCKKLKKKITESIESKKDNVTEEDTTEVIEYKSQIFKLKTALNQTLEANYNLSVKFLRMKNTKLFLKNRLKKLQTDHEQAMRSLQVKINNIKNDISDVVDQRFMLPISPSNKKYLKIIKQNGALMHENLCLQMDVDRLTYQLEYLKCIYERHESKEKLKHAKSWPQHKKEIASGSTTEIGSKLTKRTESQTQLQSTSTQSIKIKQSKTSMKQETSVLKEEGEDCSQEDNTNTNVIKIYERKKIEGIPEIITLTPNNELSEPRIETDKIDCQSISTKASLNSGQVSTSQMGTESTNYTTDTFSREAIRTQSAPEIVQTSLFVSTHKP